MNTDWSLRQRWLYAIKPASWPKLLVPMLLGQAVGVFAAASVQPFALLFGLLFIVFDGIFIVLMNDWSDQRVDHIKRRMFPEGCSPKTIPDGILTSRTVLSVGLLSGLLAMLIGVLFGVGLGRPLLPIAAAGCLLIFIAYSMPPIRLNYRGGGEVLEALGVGWVLPWINAYAQTGEIWAPGYGLFAGFMVLSLASALASGLADEVSDAEGGKTTFATGMGNPWVRHGVELLVPLAVGLWLLASLLGTVPIWAVCAAAIAVGFHLLRLRAVSDEAVTNAFQAQKLYKLHLHHAIWYGSLVLATGLLLQLTMT